MRGKKVRSRDCALASDLVRAVKPLLAGVWGPAPAESRGGTPGGGSRGRNFLGK